MKGTVRRLFIQTRRNLNTIADNLYKDLKENLKIESLESVDTIERYDIEGLTEDEYILAKETIFSQPGVCLLHDEKVNISEDIKSITIELLPGQFDSRADIAEKSLYILTGGKDIKVKTAQLILLEGALTEKDYASIRRYIINPVEKREASAIKPATLQMETQTPGSVEIIEGFIDLSGEGLKDFLKVRGLAMSLDDLILCQDYFKTVEKRDPTITEIKVLDTYWSDHCRHTTFATHLDNIEIEDAKLSTPIKEALEVYTCSRKYVYENEDRPVTLMDIATMGMRELKKRGILDNLDESEEINAASTVLPIDIDGIEEEWLIMFKNETHNHPTEIEPFGGAATCLGGAIRDPLSGRSYVYQAMRITGSSDPRQKIEDTLPGKLPQRTITRTAAEGYSSYGRGIGLAAGHVAEFYHEGFIAKRMELGAVIAAAPKENVIRESPMPGDVVILVGGRTGRDGCGGATGSSRAHTEESIETCSSEVQKGNPIEERKIQRLFRKPHVSKMIKKCNDFGAGGVSVAIGELAPGLDIDLDLVPVKYDGLDGTELAISESQERMAVVLDRNDLDKFIAESRKENLEATHVATVTEDARLLIRWQGEAIVDISREFLDTDGADQKAQVYIKAPREDKTYFDTTIDRDIKKAWLNRLSDLNVCSQKGLVEGFDTSAGAGTVLAPFGGKYQLTPEEAMVAKVPVLHGYTRTVTTMSHGYNPYLSEWSPFHGGLYAIIEALAKIVALGVDYRETRLSLQEYFERLEDEPTRWGKPFAALLGAHLAQIELGIASIGGKDSMSGTFHDIDVPPTVVAFAVNKMDVERIISSEFKGAGNNVVLLTLPMDERFMPDFKVLDANYSRVHELANRGKILSSYTVKGGGLCEAISKMCFGNMMGFKFEDDIDTERIFMPEFGSLILELDAKENIDSLFEGTEYKLLGKTSEDSNISIKDVCINLFEALETWIEPLEDVFPIAARPSIDNAKSTKQKGSYNTFPGKVAKPRVLIPVFPGVNGEYEAKKAFEQAGAIGNIEVFQNIDSNALDEAFKSLVDNIGSSQIIMLPAGVESGPMTAAFLNARVKDAIMDFLHNRNGLILGVGIGFATLLKLGLIPYGEIRPSSYIEIGLAPNKAGMFISKMIQTEVISNNSPWLSNAKVGDVHILPISNINGRVIMPEDMVDELLNAGQIATQYIGCKSIEGMTSPDGRILGRLGYPERMGEDTFINIPGSGYREIFENGISYFS
ncbi:MAG: phosphoribosylformylglycinamidine synthase [Clostridiales bacterium]|nr:phosphoribosylformylglycinamidine synthase [Clostridiales bacterium]